MTETLTPTKTELEPTPQDDIVYTPSTKLPGGLLPGGARAVSNPEANRVEVIEINPIGQLVRTSRGGQEVRADLASSGNHLQRQYR